MKTQDKVAIGLVSGVLVGAVVGLVLAPKSGKRTRQAIQARANELRRRATKTDNGNGGSMGHYAEISG